MQITPGEIDKIEECGEMNGRKVSLIRTKGGFWIATGKKKGAHSEEALAAGSHPAIVKYNLEKQYPDYHPEMLKSEGFIEPIVDKHSHFLSEDLRKSGHDIFSIQNGSDVEFQITRHNSTIAKVDAVVEDASLIIETLNIPKEFAKGIAGASVEKAFSIKAGLKSRL